ncbi:MAG TPA: tRNA lysidine(34) synthetase TilS, partial [Quisquiliibacterium sp.]|nr:tRNA lysidine(34) synthetase TilS [Quisquiliibacterium sp.]
MLVAYSGGLDSSVLLHAAARVFGADALVAVHVHHGLQPQADAWAQHCADQARALGVECVCRRVRAVHGATDGAAEPASTGDGLEAWARRRRYAALEAVARARAAVAVLTAHHADDQVETVLMRIARGTGADGLTAMRAERPLSRSLPGVVLARPLLSLPRAVVRDYARDHGLRWVEDPSNRDPRMLRNAVRTQVLPALDAVAPAFRTHLLRTVAHVAVAADAARARAQDDLMRAAGGTVHDGEGAADPVVPGAVRRIDRRGLAGLGADRQAAALRAWCAVLGVRPPTQARLDEMHRQLMEGRGPYGRVRHEGMLWTRYRDTIEVRPLSDVIDAAPARDAGTGIDAGTGSGIGAGARAGTAPRLLVLHWNGEPALPLPHTGGTLWVVPAGAH